ncbi:nucleoside deaminase [Oceanobacillus massiliensis]|uniref:nucleoside deaminase n=1 Tax=Oceanobacillus massiliensis TaxID=1465765 RepID=UPI000288AD81|nr:nucleoside deaminase [Oceanobacillus massiliensis]
MHEYFLSKTIDLAVESLENGGGPFAAIVVDKDSNIIGTGTNGVTKNNDPTAHAEVLAIRDACSKLEDFQLKDCILYTSCEPCPMCLGAIYWARVKKVYYAADQQIAAMGGFDDAFIYDEIAKEHVNRKIPFQSISLENRSLPFEKWLEHEAKISY